jgi:16S rRNA (cytosine1402-N4)-methyltransferase
MRSPSTGTVEDSSSALFPAGPSGEIPERTSPVEGLRMVLHFTHEPVMAQEVVALFAPVPPGVVVDATLGGGGHSAALLRAHPHLAVLGIDRDPAAVVAASALLSAFGDRAVVRHGRFGDLARIVGEAGPVAGLSGVLFDLGVSSPQLDRPERGFSYRQAGPLDMRMDPTTGPSALDLVNGMSEEELAQLFVESGEGRMAKRIARALVGSRPLSSTAELADVVSRAVPAALRRRGHPARRVFQAIRIAVNDELGQLAAALPAALERLVVGGRCVAIAYHSGEDRLVKQVFAGAVTGGCTCPPGLPCVCGALPEHRLVFRGSKKASPEEVAANRRAESARLRALQRIAAPSAGDGVGS